MRQKKRILSINKLSNSNETAAGSKAKTRHHASHEKLNLNAPEITSLLEAFPCYVMIIDEQHRILQANSAVQTLGIEPQDIIGKYCPKVIHGFDEPWYACPLEEAAQKSQPVEREVLDKQSGRWIRSAIYPIHGSTAEGQRIFLHLVSDITDQKRFEERSILLDEQLRSVLRLLETIREKERINLAREMHDEIGSILTGIKIDLSWLDKRLPHDQKSLMTKIMVIDKLVDQAISAVKRISADLRPGVLDDLGLSAAIEWLVQDIGKRAEMKYEFTSRPKDIVLERDCSTAIFRICKEALTNIVRHADASKIQVTLKKGTEKVVLTISDNGKGIEEKHVSDPGSIGLFGMRERARSFSGDIKINGIPGKGTLVVLTIPLEVKKH